MGPGWLQILLVAVLVIVLFGGRGKISSLMGDVAKGIKSFRSGLADPEKGEESSTGTSAAASPKVIDHEPREEYPAKAERQDSGRGSSS